MKKVWYRHSEGGWYITVRENGRRKQLLLLKGPNTRDSRRQAEQLGVQELTNRLSVWCEPHHQQLVGA